MSKILITGANGFIGSALIDKLLDIGGYTIVASYRRLPPLIPVGISALETGDLKNIFDWKRALVGTDTVIHLAGCAHSSSRVRKEVYNRINVEATLELAHQAVEQGVGRFRFYK
jgi:nucleoside-diphosphate-sugar epimerase